MKHSINFLLFAVLTLSAISNTVACGALAYYSTLSDDALYAATANGKDLGGCAIRKGRPDQACDLYVVAHTKGRWGSRGWPRRKDGYGNGCVMAPDMPKKRVCCNYFLDRFQLRDSDRDSFCTRNGTQNAINQVRHALNAGDCLVCNPF